MSFGLCSLFNQQQYLRLKVQSVQNIAIRVRRNSRAFILFCFLSLCRRQITSCLTLITGRSLEATVMTTWTRLFTETPALNTHVSILISTFITSHVSVCRETVQQLFDFLTVL